MNYDCMKEHHQRFHGPVKIFKIIGMAIIGIAFAALLALIFGLAVKALWNWLMPTIFGLPLITYWQAFGLIILAKILFGSFGNHHHKKDHIHKNMDKKWHTFYGVSDDCCSPDRGKDYEAFWKKEGKARFDEFLKKKETEENE